MVREGRRRYYPRRKGRNPNANDVSQTMQIFPDSVFTIDYDKVDDFLAFNGGDVLTEDEERRLVIGCDAWEESMRTFHNPAIPDPKFAFDRSKSLGFFIEMKTWKVFMNLANSPSLLLDKEIFNYYHALAMHEISHYIICPYDNLTNGRMIKSAIKHVPEQLSPIVVNFFADLYIDMKNFQRKPKVMEFELRQTLKMTREVEKSDSTQKNSKFFKVLTKCYEIMWDIDLNLPKSEYNEVEKLAEKISKIILKDFEDFTNWEKKVNQIARLLKEIINEDFTRQLDGGSDKDCKNSSSGGANATQVRIPKDVQIAMGNPLEVKSNARRNQDVNDSDGKSSRKRSKKKGMGPSPSAEDQRDAEELASEMDLKDFKRVNRVMGLVDDRDAIRTFYRGLSRDMIDIKVYTKKPSGSVPIGIEPWRVGDPIEKLDILQSALVSPKPIPNITTRKWLYKEGPGIEHELKPPDLMLVVDSSGSMDWNPYSISRKSKNPYHLALIASFASIQFAIKKGVKVSAINFSDNFIVQPWTKDYRKTEVTLLRYIGMGTTLPTKKIRELAKMGERNSLILLITDFDIYNWEIACLDLQDILKMGNKLVGFFIGGDDNELRSDNFEELSAMGARFYVISKINDLIGLVIKEVKEVYGE